jgi:hypothetical protein
MESLSAREHLVLCSSLPPVFSGGGVTRSLVWCVCLATGIVRKLLECFYTNYELKYLDDVLPGSEKKKTDKEV